MVFGGKIPFLHFRKLVLLLLLLQALGCRLTGCTIELLVGLAFRANDHDDHDDNVACSCPRSRIYACPGGWFYFGADRFMGAIGTQTNRRVFVFFYFYS